MYKGGWSFKMGLITSKRRERDNFAPNNEILSPGTWIQLENSSNLSLTNQVLESCIRRSRLVQFNIIRGHLPWSCTDKNPMQCTYDQVHLNVITPAFCKFDLHPKVAKALSNLLPGKPNLLLPSIYYKRSHINHIN